MTALGEQLDAYVAEVVDAIDGVVPVVGAYLLGSAALGSFDPATSDLDVVLVAERPLEAHERTRIWRALDDLPVPVRKLELVVYAAGARPPAYDLNYPDGDGEPGFWFVLDAAIAQERARPLRGRPWQELLEPVTEAETRRAAEEMARWADERDDELARPHGIRARHYLEHGTWMTKQEATR